MKNFFEYLYKYGLHDCLIDGMTLENEGVCFFFDSGVYELDSNGVETTTTSKCKMIINIENFDSLNSWEHIEIKRLYKKKVYEVEIDHFIKTVNRLKFDIKMNYFSSFCNTILIKGYMDDGKYEIQISEVENIQFFF